MPYTGNIISVTEEICLYKGTRDHTLNLVKPEYIRDSGKFFFSHRARGRWNSLDQNNG